MKRVLVLVEGQTEDTFISQLLRPHLWTYEVDLIPKIIITKRVLSGKNFKGGVTSYGRIKEEIQALFHDTSARLVTTMLDFYGLPQDFPGQMDLSNKSSLEKVTYFEEVFSRDINNSRFSPYLSLHEFEALLFSSPKDMAEVLAFPQILEKLEKITEEFPSPEDIDDQPISAPSKRIQQLFPTYNKPVFGSLISQRIGLEKIRAKCQHFNSWLTKLEKLKETSP